MAYVETMACPQCQNLVETVPGTVATCPGCGFSAVVPGEPPPLAPLGVGDDLTHPWNAGVMMAPATSDEPRPPPSIGRAIAALLVNVIAIPGLGTMIGGRMIDGLLQITLLLTGFIVPFVGPLAVVGVWVWALVSGIGLIQEASAAQAAGPMQA